MKKNYKKLLVLGTAFTMSVMASMTSLAAISPNTSWSNRWVGGNDTWQVKNANGNGYIANSWWMDPSTTFVENI